MSHESLKLKLNFKNSENLTMSLFKESKFSSTDFLELDFNFNKEVLNPPLIVPGKCNEKHDSIFSTIDAICM